MKSLKGQLLIAAESLLDPNFARTVVLMLEHGPQGAAGLVLNRSTSKTIRDVWHAIFQEDCHWRTSIYLGGPVTGPLTALHTVKDLGDSLILPGLYATTDPDKLKEIVRTEPEPCKFFAGYAGWSSGQLEAELEEDSWMMLPAKNEHVFWPGREEVWSLVASEVGYSALFPSLHAKIPEDPTTN